MAEWMVWLILAGVLVGLEIFTGTFYLLMVGIGFAAGGITALLGGDRTLQFLVAAVLGVFATIVLRRKRAAESVSSSSSDPNVNLDIGQTISIGQWHDQGGTYTSRAAHRGTMWDIDLMHGSSPDPGLFIIREVRGSRLVVSNYFAQAKHEEA